MEKLACRMGWRGPSPWALAPTLTQHVSDDPCNCRVSTCRAPVLWDAFSGSSEGVTFRAFVPIVQSVRVYLVRLSCSSYSYTYKMPDDPGPPRSTTRATPTPDIRNIAVDPRSLRDVPLGDSGSAGLVAVPGAVAGSAGVAQATAHHSRALTKDGYGSLFCIE